MSGNMDKSASTNGAKYKINAMRVATGNAKLTTNDTNAHRMMFANVNDNENESGINAMDYVGDHAEVTRSANNVNEVFAVGIKGEDINRVGEQYRKMTEKQVPVRVGGDDLDEDYEARLDPTKIIGDITRALCKKYGKKFDIYRGDEKLDRTLTMAQAQIDGSTVTWEARLRKEQ